MSSIRRLFLSRSLGFVAVRLLILTFYLSILDVVQGTTTARTKQVLVQHDLTNTHIEETLHDAEKFTLRHIFHHGVYKQPDLHRKKDVKILSNFDDLNQKDSNLRSFVARTRLTNIQRLRDRRPSTIVPLIAAARQRGYPIPLSMSAWTIDSVAGPNITDKETVLNLAHMANNAYAANESSTDWDDLSSGPFNRSLDFGFDGDGLRGHIFANEDNSTIVIGIKGTSVWVYDGPDTSTNDKINDNLFGSCCCGQQGQWTWRQVCDCATSTFTCNNTCVVQALKEENRYYAAATNIFTNATAIYPNSSVWLVGHSLGGSVSGLLGLTFGVPTVTFEAVPDALAAARLGLPVPHGSIIGAPQTREFTGIYHVGHTADPVYMGVCNGATSSCSMAGYAFESQCHTGSRCVYDTVGDKGWSVSIGTHRLNSVIDDVLTQYDTVPDCLPEPECQDCFNWKYFESNHTDKTTTRKSSTSMTKTRTRTQTCKTPGWWGCLDESTTTTKVTTTTSEKLAPSTTTTTTSSTTTTLCKTPGWFGCQDRTTLVAPGEAQATMVLETAHPTSSSPPPP